MQKLMLLMKVSERLFLVSVKICSGLRWIEDVELFKLQILVAIEFFTHLFAVNFDCLQKLSLDVDRV